MAAGAAEQAKGTTQQKTAGGSGHRDSVQKVPGGYNTAYIQGRCQVAPFWQDPKVFGGIPKEDLIRDHSLGRGPGVGASQRYGAPRRRGPAPAAPPPSPASPAAPCPPGSSGGVAAPPAACCAAAGSMGSTPGAPSTSCPGAPAPQSSRAGGPEGTVPPFLQSAGEAGGDMLCEMRCSTLCCAVLCCAGLTKAGQACAQSVCIGAAQTVSAQL